MSDVVVFSETVYPESCIHNALDGLGVELVPNKKTFDWYGRRVEDYNKADAARYWCPTLHKIRLKAEAVARVLLDKLRRRAPGAG